MAAPLVSTESLSLRGLSAAASCSGSQGLRPWQVPYPYYYVARILQQAATVANGYATDLLYPNHNPNPNPNQKSNPNPNLGSYPILIFAGSLPLTLTLIKNI